MSRLLNDEEIWEATKYEPNFEEPITLQDGRAVAQAQRDLSDRENIGEMEALLKYINPHLAMIIISDEKWQAKRKEVTSK